VHGIVSRIRIRICLLGRSGELSRLTTARGEEEERILILKLCTRPLTGRGWVSYS
jgi:hypothetical protein